MSWTSIVNPAAAGAAVMAALAAVAAPDAAAQEPNLVRSSPVQAVTGAVQQITLTMGKGELFQTAAPFTKVSVSDDKIVEVMPQSDREFVFNPKGVGSTNVFVLDDKNRLIAQLDVNVVSNIQEIRQEPHQEVRQEPHGEGDTWVRVYGRITDQRGDVVKPATYRCNQRNCEVVSEAPLAASAPMANASPGLTAAPPSNPEEGPAPDSKTAP
jgi:hypothetical protein